MVPSLELVLQSPTYLLKQHPQEFQMQLYNPVPRHLQIKICYLIYTQFWFWRIPTSGETDHPAMIALGLRPQKLAQRKKDCSYFINNPPISLTTYVKLLFFLPNAITINFMLLYYKSIKLKRVYVNLLTNITVLKSCISTSLPSFFRPKLFIIFTILKNWFNFMGRLALHDHVFELHCQHKLN